MFDNDFDDEDFTPEIEYMIKQSTLMIENIIRGIKDFSVDAFNFPTPSDKVFYLDCYISKRGKNLITPDNLPFSGRILH